MDERSHEADERGEEAPGAGPGDELARRTARLRAEFAAKIESLVREVDRLEVAGGPPSGASREAAEEAIVRIRAEAELALSELRATAEAAAAATELTARRVEVATERLSRRASRRELRLARAERSQRIEAALERLERRSRELSESLRGRVERGLAESLAAIAREGERAVATLDERARSIRRDLDQAGETAARTGERLEAFETRLESALAGIAAGERRIMAALSRVEGAERRALEALAAADRGEEIEARLRAAAETESEVARRIAEAERRLADRIRRQPPD